VPKRIERLAKIYIQRKDPDGLSVMPPLQYKLRFQTKMDQIFDLDFSSPNKIEVRKPPSSPCPSANDNVNREKK
jgi:1-phosphatidylinositol-4-phosphate 5-kinase